MWFDYYEAQIFKIKGKLDFLTEIKFLFGFTQSQVRFVESILCLQQVLMEIVYNMTLHVQIAAWRKAFDMWKDHISTIEQSRHDQHIENLENQRRD